MSADPPELSRFRQRLPETSARVTVLSETSQPFVEIWYDLSSEDHFWFQWRLAATLRLLADHGIPTDRDWKAFEIGCGNGVLLAQLERATRWSVDGADLDRGALARIPPGRGRRFAYDVLERRPEFREVYDVVILYDVIEHVEETAPFLRACLDPLRPGGLLLVNVPALPWLWSRYDVAAGHRRRYDRSSLPAELAGLGVSVLETRCWGLSMIPVLGLRKLLARFAGDPTGVIDAGFRPPGALVHALLRGLGRAETALLPRPPSGTSLLLLARKQA